MAQVIIRKLNEEVVSALKARAAAHGHSLEEELRRVLAAAARPTRRETLAAAATIRELSAPINDIDLAQLIREDRAR